MTGLVCAPDIDDGAGNDQMTICIPTESCGVNGDYVSAERGVTFITSDTDICIMSAADYVSGAEGFDCSTDYDGCLTGLVCALNIEDGAGNNIMSICIPTASCGVNGNYIS